MKKHIEKYLLAIVVVLLLSLPGTHSQNQSEYKDGQVKIGDKCDKPKSIEACLVYKSRTQCEICQSNYVLKNGICEFQTIPSKYCEQFDYNGECKRCSLGLYLPPDTKECIDIKIPGCLSKNPQGKCTNCASQFVLYNGICVSKIPACVEYKLISGEYLCTNCSMGYLLIRGQCAKIPQEVTCFAPFKRDQNNKCSVPNCKLSNEYGCCECSNGYESTQRGECIVKRIPGCVDYSSQNQCRICDQYSLLYQGICYPIGCSDFNGVCKKCDMKSGFVFENGQCIIPNCLISGSNGCNLCASGRIWYRNACVYENEIDTTVCINCPSNSYLNDKKQCVRKEQGCLNYSGITCISCEQNYTYDSIFRKCIKKVPGCVYNDKAQCVSCQANYFYKQGKCLIIGCKTYNQNNRCLQCESMFKLTSLNFCLIQNCIQTTQQGCLKCIDGFTIGQDGRCIIGDPFCVAKNMYGKCIGCQEGYYLESGKCKKATSGCNYIDGRCVSCKTPFTFNPKTQTCTIDGCKNYFFGGCQVCLQGYQLKYNNCKLPNCLVSENGKCLQCDPDYIFKGKTGTCVNKDEFCFKFNKDGDCVECAPKYFMSQIQQKCLLKEPGCVYDALDQCSSCLAPFKTNGKNKCYISGCLSSSFEGCKQCKYPFQVNDQKFCSIKNCLKSDDQKCTQCFSGYLLQNGVCTTGDQYCQEYNFKSGQCLRCKQGYKVVNNKCQYADSNCLTFTQDGKCSNCLNSFFLNQKKVCQLRDSNCQQYVNGRCNKCKPYFYLYNSICYQKNKGCTLQSSHNTCTKCESGYKLTNGICQVQIKTLNWNSIDMDFFDSQTPEGRKQNKQTFTTGKLTKNGLIPSYKSGKGKLIYSSDIENKNNVSLESPYINGWQSKKSIGEWVGVQVQQRQTFYAVDIQCMNNNQMTSFKIQYLDFNNWRIQGTYDIMCESIGVIKTVYITPVQTTSIRLTVLKGVPNIKIEFYFYDKAYKAPVDQIKTNIQKLIQESVQASSQLLNNYCQSGDLCWFGLEICQPKKINGFEILYGNSTDMKGVINEVFVDYSVEGIKFECYQDCKALPVTQGRVVLNKPIYGSKMRVHVVSYTGKPDMRIKFSYD